jgi:tetratricopeptide (TPR) repeat protein
MRLRALRIVGASPSQRNQVVQLRHEPYGPCPCGSGRKYKFCCFGRDREAARVASASRWLEVGQDPDENPVRLEFEEAEGHNTKGLRLLQQRDMVGAERCFRAAIAAAPLIPAGYNNLALQFFHQGKLPEAIRMQESIVTPDGVPNPFGLAQLAHLYLVAGRDADAETVMARVLAAPPVDPFAMNRALQSLALLGRHADIAALVRGFPGPVTDLMHWFAGVAAANLGQVGEALAHLQAIPRAAPHRVHARDLLRRIESGKGSGTLRGDWPYLGCLEMIPGALLGQGLESTPGSAGRQAPWFHTRLMVDALVALLEEDGGQDATAVNVLAAVRHDYAVEVLKAIAEGTYGTDAVRLAAVRALIDRGVWSRDEPRTVWLKGEWQEAKTGGIAVSPEHRASARELPEALGPRYLKGVEAARQGRWAVAESIWRELLAEAPECTALHHNLASALLPLGKAVEAEACLRRAMAMEPGYLFAPATLAVLLCSSNRTAQAREVLRGVEMPAATHPSALAAYFAAQIRVAAAEGQGEQVVRLLEMAEATVPNEPAIVALTTRLGPLRRVASGLGQLRDRQAARRAERRRCVLPRDASLEACLGGYPKGPLVGIARALGVGGPLRQNRKDDLLAAICRSLRHTAVCEEVVRGLGEAEQAALRGLLAAGGCQDYAVFTRSHGSDAKDHDLWDLRPPESALGRLKCHGLVVEATVDRVESGFIPAELPLDSAWLRPAEA